MTDQEKLNALNAMLNSGVIGIDGDSFVFNQTAILSAMSKTDRQLLVRILAKVSKLDAGQLLQESIQSDIQYLTELMESTSKVTK